MSKPVMATTPPKAMPEPRQDLPAVLHAAEELYDGDPGGLQADQGGGGGHGGQLQGGDEAGEVQGQGDGRHERPAELPPGDPAELRAVP